MPDPSNIVARITEELREGLFHFPTETSVTRSCISSSSSDGRQRYQPTVSGEQLLEQIQELRLLLGLVDRDMADSGDVTSIGYTIGRRPAFARLRQ